MKPILKQLVYMIKIVWFYLCTINQKLISCLSAYAFTTSNVLIQLEFIFPL